MGWVQGLRKRNQGRLSDTSVLRGRVIPFSELRKQSLEIPVSAVGICGPVCKTSLKGPILCHSGSNHGRME